jgi:hypothetical protein
MAAGLSLRYTEAAVAGKEVQDHASIPFDTGAMSLAGLCGSR